MEEKNPAHLQMSASRYLAAAGGSLDRLDAAWKRAEKLMVLRIGALRTGRHETPT